MNVQTSSGKSVAGFPQVMQNPISRTGDTSRREFEIPISRALKKNIEKRLLAHDQFVTHVDLIAVWTRISPPEISRIDLAWVWYL